MTEIKDLIKELNRTNKLLEETYLNYFDMCERVEVLEKCLDEIEEICKYDCEHECSNDNSTCGICSCLEQRILRKIKEVKEQ